MAVKEDVLAWATTHKKAFRPFEVIEATGLPQDQVRNSLVQLATDGMLERVERGVYVVTEGDATPPEKPAKKEKAPRHKKTLEDLIRDRFEKAEAKRSVLLEKAEKLKVQFDTLNDELEAINEEYDRAKALLDLAQEG